MASRRRLRRRECGSKVRFESLQQAIRARPWHRGLRAYECAHCHAYHLGHRGGAGFDTMQTHLTKLEYRAGHGRSA